MDMSAVYGVIIIGGGPAGLAAAIYTARAGESTLLLDQTVTGGRAVYALDIENYPGFPEGVRGTELASRLAKQAEKFGATIVTGERVTGMKLEEDPKKVLTAKGEYSCGSVVITTGLTQRKAGLPGEEKLTGRGVSYCATCDGYFFKGRKVIVLGAGEEAAEDLLYLSSLTSEIVWISDSKVTAGEELIKKLEEKGIKPTMSLKAVAIEGEESVRGLRVMPVSTPTENEMNGDLIPANGVFIAIGTAPSADILKQAGIALDEDGFVKVNVDMETNLPGVFAAGDCTGKSHQIVVAVGQGATAGMRAASYIKAKKARTKSL